MSRKCFAIATAAGLLTAIGTSADAAVGKHFTSTRYHYTITLAPGWGTRPGRENPDTAFPDPDGSQWDEFDDIGNPLFPIIGVTAQKLRAKMTAQQWAQRVAEAITTLGCSGHTQTSRRFAGEVSQVLSYPKGCGANSAYMIVIATVHHGRGYDVFWMSPANNERTRTQATTAFYSFLTTFRFTS